VLPPPRRDRVWVHVLLLLLTFATTTMVGVGHYQGFLVDFVPRPLLFTSTSELWLGGLWYSVPLLLILGAHEMGHYLACRIYGIDATMPYFIPVPIGMIGTFGAFIRIRGRINTRPVLFDMAAAGPIAGFAIAVPAMFTGLMLSRVVRLPADFVGFELGEPLLFQAAGYMVFGSIPDGWALNLHPMAMASWFGMLVTALNLMPVGQLDGGHIAYAVLGRRSSLVSLATVAVLVVLLAFVSYSWAPWVVLLLVMMKLFGLHHPPTFDEHVPLDRGRLAVAVLTALILVACFTPAPIEVYELIRPR
jgi:membrane-associated protease RseP (regulator of RpoE activity)